MSDPSDTFRFYVRFSHAGTWSIEPMQGLPLGQFTRASELVAILRRLAELVEEQPRQVPDVRYPEDN